MELLVKGLIIVAAFIGMEGVAWGLYKYILHTFLWFIHDSHHYTRTGIFEKKRCDCLIFWYPQLAMHDVWHYGRQ